jgi:hypothetical protein
VSLATASSIGRNKLAQFRQNSIKSEPELRKLVPAYKASNSTK